MSDTAESVVLAPGSRQNAEEADHAAPEKPTHYRVLCISLYTDDVDRLDAKVGQLKDLGHTKASRSSLIRAALDQVDLSRVPRGA